jgi:hypothetical protein
LLNLALTEIRTIRRVAAIEAEAKDIGETRHAGFSIQWRNLAGNIGSTDREWRRMHGTLIP